VARLGSTPRFTPPKHRRERFCDLRARLNRYSAEILLLNLRAWQLREPLRLNEQESLMTRRELSGWSIPVSVGIMSLVLALTGEGQPRSLPSSVAGHSPTTALVRFRGDTTGLCLRRENK
jgi:hypothetical protein